MATTLGAHSPRLDRVRALRTKDGRQAHAAFAVEGTTMLAEARAAGHVPEAVYATAAVAPRLQRDRSVPDDRLFIIPDSAMQRLSDLETPPGLLGVFPIVLEPLEAMLASGEAIVLLAGLSDPGNAGTLVRTAEIFGVPRVVFGGGGVEPHNPKVVRATMGAVFRTQIGVAQAAELLARARHHGYTLVATGQGGTPLPQVRFPAKSLIAIGNERHGVTSWLRECDLSVTIPQSGRGESLNAAIAGGIVLYALAQQLSGRVRDESVGSKNPDLSRLGGP